VLIDADADAYMVRYLQLFSFACNFNYLKFKDEYYSDSDGGQKAAWDLQAGVRGYLTTAKPHLVNLPITVKAFVNGDGMSKFLSSKQPSGSLWDFGKGFSQAHAESDFIFVGSGKDRADKKIKSEDTFLRYY
jgi:hypothetical protein